MSVLSFGACCCNVMSQLATLLDLTITSRMVRIIPSAHNPTISATAPSFPSPIRTVNGWLLQEVTKRLAGRIDSSATTFASANDLASAFRRAAAAHGEHEKRIGQTDPNWPDWYAEYLVREQSGEELPQ
jgi:hypothetical protein